MPWRCRARPKQPSMITTLDTDRWKARLKPGRLNPPHDCLAIPGFSARLIQAWHGASPAPFEAAASGSPSHQIAELSGVSRICSPHPQPGIILAISPPNQQSIRGYRFIGRSRSERRFEATRPSAASIIRARKRTTSKAPRLFSTGTATASSNGSRRTRPFRRYARSPRRSFLRWLSKRLVLGHGSSHRSESRAIFSRLT